MMMMKVVKCLFEPIVTTFGLVALILVIGSVFYDGIQAERAITACEAHLTRDSHCKIAALPENKP